MTTAKLHLVPDARTIQPVGIGWNNPTNDYPKTMIPAVETAELNGWGRGTWLTSAKWKRSKLIRLVRDDGVKLAYRYRDMANGTMLVKGFPADVHRVQAPC